MGVASPPDGSFHRSGHLLIEDVSALTREAGELYDRIIGHDPADMSCAF